MVIKKESNCLFIRIPDFLKYNAIEEHIKIIKEKGFTWLLKLGNYPNRDFMKKFMLDGGFLIVKSTPRNGNKFYVFKVESIDYDNDCTFPLYYDELLDYYGYTPSDVKKNFLWLKVVEYKELPVNLMDAFITLSNKKPMINAIMRSRAAQIYGQTIIDINL